MTQNTVEVKNLVKTFGKFRAVDDVSFYIPQGEIFGLLGPNGAGKTTTIRMLIGILRPDSGTANVLGFDVRKKPEEVKKRIGYMSQKFSLYNDLSVRENLDFYAAIYNDISARQRRIRVDEMLERVDLTDMQKSLTRSLSGAWRQRLALACAIVHKPKMLFLDEATAGVDPVARRYFWDLIYRLAGEGISVLATTHYMDEADYCNTIGMMYQGRLVSLASPDTIKDSLPGVLLQVDVEDPLEVQKVLQNVPCVLHISIQGMQLHVTVKRESDIGTIQRTLARANMPPSNIEIIQPSLEDAFTSIVSQERDKAS
ncbi:MAG TPA: ABC transporter ATP-binding protein [Anaerolineaceae bacterium]|nr:ABC transporter ATP-binding protein [Anaerolineaceae bacterium]HPX65121.1 ABC transporter ATP-binding protein [Anaerolineaceae bacterium]HQC63479.1 ABC transporter ATP-binding protein [Anaerolineaceae bacterium]